ncbi:PadR family transcriptional regulator [Streptomyces avicenniae]|uniref:PadR family transcriptional regulator n=1 Tax=Streptomyces avicenniae TaxID=500153 RepID=UPI00069B0D14|nr:PadR family transcriptional regulator [Streptomyces avicenniae]
MPPVFGHGRLRLYLLKLLAEAPRHGYEVIRLLEERFQGLYAPSAGTVYPRLAKLEAEGLVRHTEEGGRKVYTLTDEGRRELGDREAELTELEREIHDSLAALAAEIREDVSGSVRDLRQEIREATAAAARDGAAGWPGGPGRTGGDRGSGRAERDAGRRRARGEWQEAGEAAARQFEEAARRVRERVQPHAQAGDWRTGDWQSVLRESLGGLGQGIGGWSRPREEPATPWAPGRGEPEPEHASEAAGEPVDNPARELERLLDRFRDEVRDAARDHGVDQDQLRAARRHLSSTAAHLVALLVVPED